MGLFNEGDAHVPAPPVGVRATATGVLPEGPSSPRAPAVVLRAACTSVATTTSGAPLAPSGVCPSARLTVPVCRGPAPAGHPQKRGLLAAGVPLVAGEDEHRGGSRLLLSKSPLPGKIMRNAPLCTMACGNVAPPPSREPAKQQERLHAAPWWSRSVVKPRQWSRVLHVWCAPHRASD